MFFVLFHITLASLDVHLLFPLAIRQMKAKTNVGPAIVKIPNEMQGHQPQNKLDYLDAESDRDNGSTKDNILESYGSVCVFLH